MQDLEERAQGLYQERRERIFRRSDRLFARLLLFEWAAAVLVSLLFTPLTWIGTKSQLHLHVMAALVVGGALALPCLYLASRHSEEASTRYTIASAQMLMSALLIHVTGGRIETHFHVFGSLAFLGFYRDWRVFLPATAVVAADHYLRGLYFPVSVFGVADPSSWRWLEHACWVIFCDLFLMRSAQQSQAEMWDLAWQQARLENTNQRVEGLVHERTRELYRQKERFLSAFENAPIGMALVSSEGQLLEANEQLARILACSGEELIGASLPARLSPVDQDGWDWRLPCPPELRCVRANGETAWIILQVSEVRGEGYWIAQVVDITKRKLAERALLQAQKLESIGALAGGIAHEINTPVQYVGDNLRFLQEAFEEIDSVFEEVLENGMAPPALDVDLSYLREEIPAAIAQSQDGVERVAAIVRSVREYSHSDGKEMAFANVHQILENTLTVCRNEWKYVAEVVTDFDPKLSEVSCHRSDLGQLFLNLIVNAAHAIQDKRHPGDDLGRISISTRERAGRAEIRISDTGTGIPEEIRGRIFDPFFTTKEVGRGTGQGLALSHAVAAKHGGTLEVETELGRGSCFIVTLKTRQEAYA